MQPGRPRDAVYQEILERYGAEEPSDIDHDTLQYIGREHGYGAVEEIARRDLADRWRVEHPMLSVPVAMDVVEGGGSRAYAGRWAIQLDVDGSDGRSPVGALYHELGHKIDELLMRRAGREEYPGTYADVVATEMKATLALSRFDELLDRCTSRAAREMAYLQDQYRIRNGGGSPEYGPDMVEPPNRDEEAWTRFLKAAGFGGHYLGYRLAVHALDSGQEEHELVRQRPETLLDTVAEPLEALREDYRDPFALDQRLDWRPIVNEE